jgi:hypothetical protein
VPSRGGGFCADHSCGEHGHCRESCPALCHRRAHRSACVEQSLREIADIRSATQVGGLPPTEGACADHIGEVNQGGIQRAALIKGIDHRREKP